MQLPAIIIFVWIFCSVSAQERQYFRVHPSNVTVVQGGDVELHCVIGHRRGKVSWAKDGTFLGNGPEFPGLPRYQIVGNHSNDEWNFRITNAQLEDDDEFECQVTPGHEVDALRWSAFVNVLVPPSSVSFEGLQRQKVEIKEENYMDVVCAANGAKPAAGLRWYQNGRPLSDALSETSVAAEDEKRFTTRSRLRLKVSKDYNGAVFTCEAFHPALKASGPMKNDFALSVIYQPGHPQVTGYVSGQTLSAGDFVSLRCMAENGNPLPEVIWFRNSVSVSRTFVHQQEYTTNEYKFEVQAADDGAEFRCEASNLATISPLSKSIRMKVNFPPEKVVLTGPDKAKVGDTVDFSCRSSAAVPDVELKWSIDGNSYFDHLGHRIENVGAGTGTTSSSSIKFKIEKRRPELTVACKAVNDFLAGTPKREVVAKKLVKISYPPESVKIIAVGGETSFLVGEKVSLTCLAIGGHPIATVEWLKRDRQISGTQSRYDHSQNATVSDYSFTISQEDNMKEIQCRAHVPDIGGSRISDSITLHVKFQPSSLTITQHPLEFEAGKPSELNCESGSANPSPTVEWYLNGEMVVSVVAHNSTGENGGWKVKKKLFLSPTMQDNGVVYECRAWSPIMAAPISKRATLEVFYKPIFLVPISQNLEVLEGESVIMNATAYSNPKVDQYSWHKDMASYNSLRSTPPRILVNGSIIEIKNIRREEKGTYVCKAKNRFGESSMTANVVVKYPPRITRITPVLHVSEKDNVVLTCDVDAYPISVEVANWSRLDGGDLDDARFVKDFTKGSAKLLINGIRREDTGEYTCVADNGVGRAVKNSTMILVKQAPVLDHSSIHTKAGAPLGGDGELTCVADGIPEIKFRWHRDTRTKSDNQNRASSPLIYDSDRFNITSKKIGFMRYQSSLVIRKVQEKDYGVYRCIADNGEANSMEVKFGKPEAPEQPTAVRILNRTHDSVTLDWLPGFNGGLPQKYRVKYRVGNSPLRNNDLGFTSDNAMLIVDSLKAKTTYAFSIQAFNDVGKSGFVNVTVDTLGPASIVQESVKEELPILIIVLVCLVAIVLLVLNAALVVCFLRRHRRKKLEERAANARLGSTSGRKIQMYSSEAGAGSAAIYQRDNRCGIDGDDHRPSSAMSDGNGSVRTVIEVDGNGAHTGYAIASDSPRLHNGYLLDSVNDDFEDIPTDFNYAESLRANTLQRNLANGVYNVPEGSIRQPSTLDRNMNTYVAAQTVDDILSNAAAGAVREKPFSYYRPDDKRYSPMQAHSQVTNRTPYAEVRPLLSTNGPVDALPPHGSPARNPNNRANTGSPMLSTFAVMPLRTNMHSDLDEDVDSLSGDLV